MDNGKFWIFGKSNSKSLSYSMCDWAVVEASWTRQIFFEPLWMAKRIINGRKVF